MIALALHSHTYTHTDTDTSLHQHSARAPRHLARHRRDERAWPAHAHVHAHAHAQRRHIIITRTSNTHHPSQVCASESLLSINFLYPLTRSSIVNEKASGRRFDLRCLVIDQDYFYRFAHHDNCPTGCGCKCVIEGTSVWKGVKYA
ncbi:unnamed protein product [Parnassius mnemosyne]|uniref:Uncharacterized protein n=1 Tax=Parnassius mnemosyne TaxID=213953 RepID=A0AAV1M5J4_9NEOP